MGKLLAHQLKRHFSTNWFLIVAPIVATLLTFFLSAMNLSWAEIVLGFSVFGVIAFFMAAEITIIVEDYQLYYGKSALFYQSIPASASDKTFSRLIYYVITLFIYSIINGACFISLMMTDGFSKGLDVFGIMNQIFVELSKAAAAAGWDTVLILIVFGITYLIYSISKIIFSISVGSEKRLRKFGLGGPVLVYALTSLFETAAIFVIDRLGIITNIALEINTDSISVDGGAFVFFGLCLIEAIVLLGITYFEHKNRVSVG
ncbi:hypothetical protein KQI68_08435 [Peptoniphilus sp. MSJ-1]|uniref:ABC transporter permease n=1 Tax=Peptoniphilus ovalis TaxID=2841503 RepID=A0ABS6FI61_9FIRM|nr:hypothetical protein [Peptoniphilus ovalis]MBU5669860.1 hypothetical protein [Peptoniphilus ovalis]